MHLHRQHANEVAREVVISFRDMTPAARAARLTDLAKSAQTSQSANSIRGQALIAFWQAASMAVALDTAHTKGGYIVTAEAHANMREVAIVAAGDALFAYMVSVVPVSVAGLLSGAAAPV